jgi:hypothetical protein
MVHLSAPSRSTSRVAGVPSGAEMGGPILKPLGLSSMRCQDPVQMKETANGTAISAPAIKQAASSDTF